MAWTTILDLGGSPANEDCAQLGITPGFENCNKTELDVYTAAVVALNGPPPKGLRYAKIANRHDFGTYWTLALQNDPAICDAASAWRYAERIHAPSSWIEAGFPTPVDYTDPKRPRLRPASNCIAAALSITRPDTTGTFWPPENAILHTNLRDAYASIANDA